MEEFSLKKYLDNPNRRVVTREGDAVRIICTDRKGEAGNISDYQIIALVSDVYNKAEVSYTYLKNGRLRSEMTSRWDLLFADETADLVQNNNNNESQDNKSIDWEQRRYEIAKDMLAAFLSNSCRNVYSGSPMKQASDAVEFADSLIAELKKK